MKCPVEYWIWLQRTLGVGSNTDEIIAYFHDPETLYEAGKGEWLKSGLLTTSNIEKLSRYSPSQSYDILKDCEKNDWTVVTQDSPYFPKGLSHIYSSPLVLYVWGDPSALQEEVCIGMVGTRECSDYGKDIAYSLSCELAKAGFTIVSGGALGVDSASHCGAIDSMGKTVAFLGCGLGYDYLKTNGSLRRKIAHNGAVVSEFPPYTAPSRRTFPIRNRLISGFSLGTVVIEAGEKSGSLITARYAFEQGRDVFAIPGDITSSNFFGTNKLIRDGAKPVFSPMDIICEYADMFSDKIKTEGISLSIARKAGMISERKTEKYIDFKETKKKKQPENKVIEQVTMEETQARKDLPAFVSQNARKLYSFIDTQPTIVDIICEKSGMNVADILSALTELEMFDCVKMHSGNRYSL